MRVMSPEKCAEILKQHMEAVADSQAKLQIMVEYFEALCDGGEEREFNNLSLLARGLSLICGEIINNIENENCDIGAIENAIRLFSPDPLKVKKHVAYLRSIGIRTETPDIELEGPEKPVTDRELGDV